MLLSFSSCGCLVLLFCLLTDFYLLTDGPSCRVLICSICMTGEQEDSWKINSSIITGKGMITLIVQIYMMADELHLVELRRGKVMGPTQRFPLFGCGKIFGGGLIVETLFTNRLFACYECREITWSTTSCSRSSLANLVAY